MAFKADIDDIRDSLSYKLGKILRFYGARVVCSDEYAKDPTFIPMEKLIRSSDIIIIGVPHSRYKGLVIPKEKVAVDLWGITSGGKRP
jgi:UDP-N-acetyl-D-mannosaminuronic acid dehydrogenase